jgi:hypothetical protein
MLALSSRFRQIAASQLTMGVMLTFWGEFVDEKGCRIRIGEFSDWGIVIFKNTVSLCENFYEVATTVPFDDLCENFDSILKILRGVYDCTYVMFDAFRVYSDDCYARSFTGFLDFLKRFAWDSVRAFPQIVEGLSSLLQVVISKHFSLLTELNIVNQVLDVITLILRDQFVDERRLLELFLEKGGTGSMEVIDALLLQGFEVVANEPEIIVNGCQNVIRGLLKLDFDYLGHIKDLLSYAIPQRFVDELNEIFAVEFRLEEEDESRGEMSFSMWIHHVRNIVQRSPSRIRLQTSS